MDGLWISSEVILMTYFLMGILIGFVIGYAIGLLGDMWDKRIKNGRG